MDTHHDALTQLERTALSQLLDIDFMTPMQQMRLALEALIDVPTTMRGVDTAFSDHAAAILDVLSSDAERLVEAVRRLAEHVNRTSSLTRAHREVQYLLAAVANN